MMRKQLRSFAESKYFDLVGVALVVGIAIYSGYLGTRLDKYVNWGDLQWIATIIPLGLISVVNVGLSMMSTRLTGRVDKKGNFYGIINVVLSGTIDYILGNKAAYITYPITFIIYAYAIKEWNKSQEGKPNEMSDSMKWKYFTGFSIVAVFISVGSNWIGYSGNMSTLAWVTTAAFALSLIANLYNMLKLTAQYQFWLVYNFVQLAKAFVQGNYANVGKYVFYIVNSIGALILWNDEEKEQKES